MIRVRHTLLLALLTALALPCHADIPAGAQRIFLDTNWVVDGAADVRYRTANTGRTSEAYIQAAEVDAQHPISYHHVRTGNFFIQGIVESPPDQTGGATTAARIGEAYVTYRLPVLTQTDSTATLRVGQFPVALGLTSVYDTHLQIMQSLYPEAIGERIDWGAALEGRFNGVLDYRVALTAGTGPDKIDSDANQVVSFRLGRLFATQVGVFNVGGSLLAGKLPLTRVNPETGFAPILPPSGYVNAPYGYASKTRIAGDGQWTYRQFTIRGEGMVGADGDDRVFGYFGEGEYRLAPGFTAVVASKYWDYGLGGSKSVDNGAGMNVSYGNNLSVRFLIEERHDVPVAEYDSGIDTIATHFRHLFTVQVLTRF